MAPPFFQHVDCWKNEVGIVLTVCSFLACRKRRPFCRHFFHQQFHGRTKLYFEPDPQKFVRKVPIGNKWSYAQVMVGRLTCRRLNITWIHFVYFMCASTGLNELNVRFYETIQGVSREASNIIPCHTLMLGLFPLWDREIYPEYINLFNQIYLQYINVFNQPTSQPTNVDAIMNPKRTQTWTKWPIFCRRRFQMHFLESTSLVVLRFPIVIMTASNGLVMNGRQVST